MMVMLMVHSYNTTHGLTDLLFVWQTWDFLWSAIKQADVFVSHPVANFVPDDVPMENVVCIVSHSHERKNTSQTRTMTAQPPFVLTANPCLTIPR